MFKGIESLVFLAFHIFVHGRTLV